MVDVGFKKTEIGLIPEDWDDPLSFDELFKISGGLSASRDQLSDKGICYLHYGDIHARDLTYIDVEDEYYSILKLNINLVKASRKSLLKDGDMVFVDASEDDDGVSKFVAIDNRNNIDFISGLHTIVAKSKDGRIHNEYKHYIFENQSLKNQFIEFACGTKVKGLNKTNIKKVLIAFPPLPEQKKIANVLSDIDNLIQIIKKLIAKKKDIKKGAMQNLLTGNKRLKGFSGEWVERIVKELGEIVTGSTPSTASREYWEGDIPWVTPTDIDSKKNIYKTQRQISEDGLKVVKELKANTVLITCIASIGKNAILKKRGACNQQINAIMVNLLNDAEYLYYLFEISKALLLSKAGITATNIISKTVFEEISLCVPKYVEEQIAIASILSDMDNELEELENKLNKYKQIKQGMMQQLLAGRIRLI
jgi:type I restriction enzyme, S subunit